LIHLRSFAPIKVEIWRSYESRACSELAQATEADLGALYRIMCALASVGIFAEGEFGRFHLTSLAEGL
jgi:hypothetical protein